MRRIASIPIIATALCVISALGWSGSAQASSSQLNYQISDARAYGYKASIAQPVIQAAPKCAQNPDKYHCRDYDHKKNCPNKIAIGAKKLPADPQPPEGVDGQHGGAGQGAGNGNSGVPQSSAVRLNRLFSDGALGREGNVLASNGVSSLQYVDLGSPPWNPEAHTETDAFSNLPKYEERCYETGSNGNYDPKASSHAKPGDSYAHMFSHSQKGPETDAYTECFQSQCQFNTAPLSPAAAHGLTQVHLQQTGDTVRGVLSAELEDLNFGNGGFVIKELKSYATFESDGTAQGLRWNVVTTAQGVTLGGQPINFPQGQSIEIGAGDQGVSIGMAGPYVSTAKDGSTLTIVAPGMYVATSQQTAFFAGAEMQANFGQGQSVSFPPLPGGNNPPPSSTGGSGGVPATSGSSAVGPSTGGGNGFPPSTGGTTNTPQPAAAPQFALLSKHDPPWAPVSILAIGLLGFLIVFLRWAQQFEWGRRMYEVQPIRGFQWLYRAFVKT
jgi:hypothetical protein